MSLFLALLGQQGGQYPGWRIFEELGLEFHEREGATYLWVAETILRKFRGPLSARQIVNYGLEEGLFADRDISRTPQKSMQARLSTEILSRKAESKFVRTSKGRFLLREHLPPAYNANEAVLREFIADRRAPPEPVENVLVVPRQGYQRILDFQGFSPNYNQILKQLIHTESLRHMPRTHAELDFEFKQFISYTIIQNKNRILTFRRGQYNRAAAFLRGARCVGFGGHVTEDDFTLLSYSDYGIRANAAREISEELHVSGKPAIVDPNEIECLGFINDNSSDVGIKHVAAVLRYWAPDTESWRNPTRGEASIAKLAWVETAGEPVDLNEYEYWSQIVIRSLFPSAVRAKPSYKIVNQRAFSDLHLLCVAGSIGSGKSITTQSLCERAGYTQVNSGAVLAGLLNLPPVPETPREVFQTAAHEFISEDSGPENLAKALLQAAESVDSGKVIIDGIRQLATLECLKRFASRRVATLFVQTPPDVAYRLYSVREASNPDLGLSEFMKIYNAPVESEVRHMIGDADAIIFNWFGIEEFELSLVRMVAELGIGDG